MSSGRVYIGQIDGPLAEWRVVDGVVETGLSFTHTAEYDDTPILWPTQPITLTATWPRPSRALLRLLFGEQYLRAVKRARKRRSRALRYSLPAHRR